MKSRAKHARKKSRECLAAKATRRLSSRRAYSKNLHITRGRGGSPEPRERLGSIAPPEGNLKLFHHRTEGQDDLAVEFVKHLRESGVDRRKSAENSFVSSELFETRTGVNEIANRQEKEKNRQRTENDLPGDMQAEGAEEHHCREQTPHKKISRHRGLVGGRGPR